MAVLIKFITDNFFLIFAIALLWNVFAVGFLLWKRKRRGLILPKLSDPNVVYSEQFAPGSSHKSLTTRMGGASNTLTIIVTKSHLAITTFFPSTVFAGTYDLEHLIPISEITDVELKNTTTEVEFQLGDGTRRKLSLRLRDTAGFLAVVQEYIDSGQDARGISRQS